MAVAVVSILIGTTTPPPQAWNLKKFASSFFWEPHAAVPRPSQGADMYQDRFFKLKFVVLEDTLATYLPLRGEVDLPW